MSYPRTPTTTTSAATTTPNATPSEHYAASPATPTVSATPSASTPSKPPRITHRCFSHRYFRRSWGSVYGSHSSADLTPGQHGPSTVVPAGSAGDAPPMGTREESHARLRRAADQPSHRDGCA